MTKYFINLHGVSTKDPKFNNLLSGGEMRIEFTREQFEKFHKCAHLWCEKPESIEWLDAFGECSDLIYNKLDEYYARLREIVILESVDTPFVMWESWDIDGDLYTEFFGAEHE